MYPHKQHTNNLSVYRGVEELIKWYPELINVSKKDGFTALHVAAINGYTDIVSLLALHVCTCLFIHVHVCSCKSSNVSGAVYKVNVCDHPVFDEHAHVHISTYMYMYRLIFC